MWLAAVFVVCQVLASVHMYIVYTLCTYVKAHKDACMYMHTYRMHLHFYSNVYILTCIVHIHIYLYIQHMDIHTYIMYYVASCFFLRFFVVFVFVLIENLNAVECGLHCCCYCHARSRSLLHVLFTAAFGQRVVVCFVFVLLPKLAN